MRVALALLVSLASGCFVVPVATAPAPPPAEPRRVETPPPPPAPVGIPTAAQGELIALATSRLPRFVTVHRDRLFWSNGLGELSSVPLTGGEVRVHHRPESGSRDLARVLASDGETLYFSSRLGLHRLDAELGRSEMVVPISAALYVTVDDRFLYFTRFDVAGIWRVEKIGGHRPVKLISTKLPSSLIARGDYLYWTSYGDGSINRIHRTTRKSTTLARARRPTGLAVSGDRIVWGTESDGAVFTKLIEGGGEPRVVAQGAKNHDVFASDADFVYWCSWLPDGKGQVVRAPLAGGALELLATELRAPVGITVVDGYAYVANKGEDTLLRITLPRAGPPR